MPVPQPPPAIIELAATPRKSFGVRSSPAGRWTRCGRARKAAVRPGRRAAEPQAGARPAGGGERAPDPAGGASGTFAR